MSGAMNIDGSEDAAQTKWNQAKAELVERNEAITEDEYDIEISAWEFRKKGWGSGMWAEIERTFIDDNEIKKIVEEIIKIESGYKITNTGVKARNWQSGAAVA